MSWLSEKGKPRHKEVFRPYQRGIAFGHIRGGMETEILDNIVPRTYHEFYRHSIPGWFGMSGSMICVIEKDLQIKVIGLCKSFKWSIEALLISRQSRVVNQMKTSIDWFHSRQIPLE